MQLAVNDKLLSEPDAKESNVGDSDFVWLIDFDQSAWEDCIVAVHGKIASSLIAQLLCHAIKARYVKQHADRMVAGQAVGDRRPAEEEFRNSERTFFAL